MKEDEMRRVHEAAAAEMHLGKTNTLWQHKVHFARAHAPYGATHEHRFALQRISRDVADCGGGFSVLIVCRTERDGLCANSVSPQRQFARCNSVCGVG